MQDGELRVMAYQLQTPDQLTSACFAGGYQLPFGIEVTDVDAGTVFAVIVPGLDAVASQAWELLGPAPRQPAADDAEGVEAVLDDVLRNRMLVTLANLACRRTADAELARQLLAYIDQAITAQGEDLGGGVAPDRDQLASSRKVRGVGRQHVGCGSGSSAWTGRRLM